MSPRAVAHALLWAALTASTARAQNSVTLRVARREGVSADAGDVMTAAFTLRNSGSDSTHVRVSLAVPAGWLALTGRVNVHVAPHDRDVVLLSVATPSGAPAGRYVLRASVDDQATADSLVVTVREHRAVEVLPLDAPGWVATGMPFAARFLVRNHGNLPATYELNGTSVQHVKVRTEPSVAQLPPGGTVIVEVRGMSHPGLLNAVDDLVELRVSDRDDNSVSASASQHTTFVPRGTVGGNYSTVPIQIAIRAAGAPSGVSPVVIQGGGLLADGRTSAVFSLAAPTNRRSQFGFGEREEYKLLIENNRWKLKLGDNIFALSPLTSSGLLGLGGEVGLSTSWLEMGAYAQRPRWMSGSTTEYGARIGMPTAWPIRLFGTAMERMGDKRSTALVGTAGIDARLPFAGSLELEGARSDSGAAAGLAMRARLFAHGERWSISASGMRADSAYAGPLKGATVGDASAEYHPLSRLSFGVSASGRDWHPPLLPHAPASQRFTTTSASISWVGVLTLEYTTLERRDASTDSVTVSGHQRSVRASTSMSLGRISLTTSAERGLTEDRLVMGRDEYTALSLNLRADFGSAGVVNLYGSKSYGATLSSGTSGVQSSGANIQLKLPLSLELLVAVAAQRATLGDYDGSGVWFGQGDVRLDYRFDNGATLGLRAHRIERTAVFGTPNASGLFAEYRMPLHMPTGRSRDAGRAIGMVRDALTGAPVSGVLVRMNGNAALTDAKGRVMFRGLPPALHRVELDASHPTVGELVIGNAEVDLRHAGTKPVEFNVAVTRGAAIRAVVRRYDAGGSTINARADTLVDAGVMANVLVALEGAKDTLYQSSDEKGRIDFGTVAPGAWVMRVRTGDLPAFHNFANDRVSMVVSPGERREVELRLVPQRRSVTFVGDGMDLRAKKLPENKEKP